MRVKAALAVMTLPYSDAFFVSAYPRECTETFQAGHVAAFAFFGGVPTKTAYDNTRLAVSRIVGPNERTLTREFLRLESHFLFTHRFCRVARGNEKGHVENLVGYGRRNFLVPVPSFASFTELNAHLRERCLADLQRRLRGKRQTKAELLADDQAAMLPLPANDVRAAAGRAAAGELAVAGAVRPQRLLGPDSVRPPRADRDRRDRADRDQLRHRARRDAPARLGRGADHLRPASLPGVAGAQAGRVRLRPAAGAVGPARRASGCCGAGSRPTSAPNGTREFIKVLRLMERREPRRADRRGRRGAHDRRDQRRRGRADPLPPRRAAGRPVQPRRAPAPQVRPDRPARPHPLRGTDRDRSMTMKPLETKSLVLLRHHLKALRLPTIGAEAEKVAAQAAADNQDHLSYLLQLCELELLEREKRAAERRLKAARFPTTKTLEGFDFTARPSVNKRLVAELARCEYWGESRP